MIVSINQPAYLPWIGYFHRIYRSDVHIVLDNVQFEKNSMINRNKIRNLNSWEWLTVPVKTKNKFKKLDIKNLEIDNNTRWRSKHLKKIIFNYSKTKYFKEHENFFKKIYEKEWLKLFPLTQFINEYIIDVLKINTKIIYASELDPKLSKSEMILELCKKVGAKKYISGPFGRDYLNKKDFDNNGIIIEFHNYIHPIYSQAHSGFEQNMSIIDLLFNHGNNCVNILDT